MYLGKISILGECLMENKTLHRAKVTFYPFLSDHVSAIIYC